MGLLTYRNDIDGLRAVAVLAVLLFHIGWLPNGYLGVDVFFVISGFLITGGICREQEAGRFSAGAFYMRRIRRIIPVTLLAGIAALVAGMLTMLPDDLENLSMSVVASNMMANNVLQYYTTGNYWDVVNSYKPLMHTWSLGVEEQFYLLYPLLFFMPVAKSHKRLLLTLAGLGLLSVALSLTTYSTAARFYLLPHRAFELCAGGVCALAMMLWQPQTAARLQWSGKWAAGALLVLVAMLCWPVRVGNMLLLPVVAAATIVLLATRGRLAGAVLENRWMTAVGRMSFSLYLWHQPVLAFTRYLLGEADRSLILMVALPITLVLTWLSYYGIERPFRNKERMGNRVLAGVLGIAFALSTGGGIYIYLRAGVIRDVPELGITADRTRQHMHNLYNERVYEMDKPFTNTERVNVLVVGNSFARDWVNILLAADEGRLMEVSYTTNTKYADERLKQADLIFFSNITREQYGFIVAATGLDTNKVQVVGTKNFGVSNGVFYTRRHHPGYGLQRTAIDTTLVRRNTYLKQQWGDKYIDLMALMADKDGKVPVFTPGCMFISQDCRHLTPQGAAYIAWLLRGRLRQYAHSEAR